MKINVVLAYYTLCCFQYSLQSIWGISGYFVYYKYVNRNKENVCVYDYVYYTQN